MRLRTVALCCPVQSTLKWIGDVVVDLRLCPWAGAASTRVVACDDASEVRSRALEEMKILTERKTTTLLAVPMMDLETFLEMAHSIESDIDDLYRGTLQLATFHPQYRFADSDDDDPTDYTNRSPYPLLHFLREDDVAEAIAAFNGSTDAIWQRNKRICRSLGRDELQRRLDASYVSDDTIR